ncbi:hypothetical protein LguiB_019322 [Lonicera macranthoides]
MAIGALASSLKLLEEGIAMNIIINKAQSGYEQLFIGWLVDTNGTSPNHNLLQLPNLVGNRMSDYRPNKLSSVS